MRSSLFFLYLLLIIPALSNGQKVSQIKKELETTPNPVAYTKQVLKKNYRIDTVSIFCTTSFSGFMDSLAYKGKEGKVYGPFKANGKSFLLQILGKAPNSFYHVSHILLDTTTFRKKFADSLANNIIDKIQSGKSSFESMARTYSSDNSSSANGGDLGWFTRGVMLPQLDNAIASHKKGEMFKVWTDTGLHVVAIKDNPKKDDGFALMLRVFL